MPEIKRLDLITFGESLKNAGSQISALQLVLKFHEILGDGGFQAVRVSRRLDFLFHDFMSRHSKFEDLLQGISALNNFLFMAQGYKVVENPSGDEGIFIGKVFEERAGAPLSVALIYREMIRKMNLGGADFVNFPGLAAIKILFSHQLLILNPAEEGRLVPVSELQARLVKRFGKGASLNSAYLEAPSELQIASRFLAALKAVYLEQRNWQKLLAVLDLLVSISPGKLVELKERGLLLYQLGFMNDAQADLQYFVANSRPSQEVENLRKLITHLQGPELTPIL